jgi:uncharacterized protein
MRRAAHVSLRAGALVAAAVSAGSWAWGMGAPAPLLAQEAPPEFVTVEVATVGVELSTGAPLALLRSGWAEVLPIWIGENEAAAIARAVTSTPMPRPMTHDLMVGMLGRLGATLEEVRVTELRDDTFIGLLVLRVDGGLVEVDARPSDALALAVRTGARVQVARALLANLPDLDFISLEGAGSVARIRGITVGEAEGGVAVLHMAPEVAGRGLEPGDRIRSVAGRPVASPSDLVQGVARFPENATIEVERVRDGSVETVRLLPRRPPDRVGP